MNGMELDHAIVFTAMGISQTESGQHLRCFCGLILDCFNFGTPNLFYLLLLSFLLFQVKS